MAQGGGLMTTDDLIIRARQLAKLAGGTTPGPWRIVNCGENMYSIYSRAFWTIAKTVWDDDRGYYHYSMQCDAALMAAAPEMAKLLSKMADALEEAQKAPD